MQGHVTDVHEPLGSASEVRRCHDVFSFVEFGALNYEAQSSFGKVYEESTIDCVSFMVVMGFFLGIEKEDCTTYT